MLRRQAASEWTEGQRKSVMPNYIARIELRVRPSSRLELRRLLSSELYPSIAHAALEAGDVLYPADKQDKSIPGFPFPTDDPGMYRFIVSLRFVSVSDHPSWEEASAWLRKALDDFHHEKITVLGMKQYEGCFD